MSLLQNLIEHPLDDDYYTRSADKGDRAPRARVATLSVLAGFALLVTVSAVETRSDRPAVRDERAALIKQIETQKSNVRQRQSAVAKLSSEVQTLQTARSDPATIQRYEQQQVIAGSVPVRGPGISVIVDNAKNSDDKAAARVQDQDLQTLVNGLWRAGAEAIAINGNRLSSLSSIRSAGEAITVNYKSLTRPYTVRAIGNPDTLQSRFLDTTGGQTWAGLRANLAMRFDVASVDDLALPATPSRRLVLRESSILKDAS